MPAEHVPHVGFLQVTHIHLVASCSMTFFMLSMEISVDGRGIGRNIFKWIFSTRTSCTCGRIYFRALNILPVDFWTNSFTWCRIYLVSLENVTLDASTAYALSRKNSIYFFTDTWMLMSGKQHVLLWIGLLLAPKTQIFQDSSKSNMGHVFWKHWNTLSSIVKEKK